MTVTIQVDDRGASMLLRALHRDQIDFALSKAINSTLDHAQVEQRAHMAKRFTQRRKKWADQSVKRPRGIGFATKRRLSGEVRMEAPGKKDRTDVLTQHEEGGQKRPKSGKRLAVPVNVRRTGSGIIGEAMRPSNLFKASGSSVFSRKGRRVRHRKGEKEVIQGGNRTFMIKLPGGKGGIYQRTGRKGRLKKNGTRGKGAGRQMASSLASRRKYDTNIKLLYSFQPTVKLLRRLGFNQVTRAAARESFDKNFREAFARAVATAR